MIRSQKVTCPVCGCSWKLSFDSAREIELVGESFRHHIDEHLRIKAERAKTKDESKPRCG
jgi:hypothetical protein